MTPAYVTPKPWAGSLQHAQYGSIESYRLAAEWLKGCDTVADWGGGTGFFQLCLPPEVRYQLVDGTSHEPGHILADLMTYEEPSEGILLRHVLEHAQSWETVLRNALRSFRRRLVLVTFTPPAAVTHVFKMKSGWPVWHFNPDDLRAEIGPRLKLDIVLHTSHPEHVYYVERGR